MTPFPLGFYYIYVRIVHMGNFIFNHHSSTMDKTNQSL